MSWPELEIIRQRAVSAKVCVLITEVMELIDTNDLHSYECDEATNTDPTAECNCEINELDAKLSTCWLFLDEVIDMRAKESDDGVR